MFARATVWTNAVNGAEPVLVIPDEAVQTVEGGPSVFVPVPGEPNTFKRVSVKVGKSVGGMLPVYQGLKPDEELVVTGSFILKAELGKSEASHEH
jgi:cobalt-zinc-cadmium efflux system membrane fusion protein